MTTIASLRTRVLQPLAKRAAVHLQPQRSCQVAAPHPPKPSRRPQFQLLAPALRAFRETHGHVAVPLRFAVPQAEPVASAPPSSPTLGPGAPPAGAPEENSAAWPEELRGMKLGTTLARFVRVAHLPKHAETAQQLRQLGVPVDEARGDWKRFLWEHVAVEALRTFHALHGDFLVPCAFRVPRGDAQWPRQTWGYKLGYWVVELRRDQGRLERYQLEDLRALGFAWDAREARWNQFFVPAMQRFAELFGASASVPQAFVVPSDDPRWPPELRGYRLGQKVNNLRCGSERRSRSPAAPRADGSTAIEWDDVELVYNNWFLLDLLHDGRDATAGAAADDATRATRAQRSESETSSGR
ncbi:hypothetical protein PybrP1_001925 [[Pythium] brassicae (nom. inval.)]|nr:hypothetical protein PybrP1_001925 [[Pythium] brassicae (nom. inval.)]